MAAKKEETSSFVLRFTQKIFEETKGEHQIQWRGNIRHVQSGEETRFINFEDATTFVQKKLSNLTEKAVENESPEAQKGILAKSLDFWKKVATDAPKIVMDSIKDPKKQVAHFQEQIQEQINQVGEVIGQKIEERKHEIDEWINPSKTDFKEMMGAIAQMSGEIKELNKKVEKLSKKK